MATYPPMVLTFDDGTEVKVEPKARDLVSAEAAGFDFAAPKQEPVRAMYAVAYAALGRLARSGGCDADLVPATFAEFLDSCDVEDAGSDPKR